MSVGVIMLVHTALDRAEQVVRHWVAGGCPVVVHVDKVVSQAEFTAFRGRLSDLPEVSFSARRKCHWGTWSLVCATQTAAEQILREHPQVEHVFLASGSCLPLRPVRDLCAYLKARPKIDFIESATTQDVPWTIGGLDAERFTLRFPFSWKHQQGYLMGMSGCSAASDLNVKYPRDYNPIWDLSGGA